LDEGEHNPKKQKRLEARKTTKQLNRIIEKRAGEVYCSSKPSENCGTAVSVLSHKGSRDYMEDTFTAGTIEITTADKKVEKVPFYAVFDGHGGDECAKFLEETFANILQKKLQTIADELNDRSIQVATKTAFLEADELFREKYSESNAGSTAVVTFLLNGKLWTASVGDSRAVLSTGDKIIQLSQDAKPTVSPFQESIEKRGGEVIGGRVSVTGYLLAPGRAIGDKLFKSVSPRPKITAVPLSEIQGKENYLVLASDGLWDVLGSKEAMDIVKKKASEKNSNGKKVQNATRALRYEAFRRKTTDNTTVMVIKLPS
jgi:serine/threonine protein phosphatase PrpC